MWGAETDMPAVCRNTVILMLYKRMHRLVRTVMRKKSSRRAVFWSLCFFAFLCITHRIISDSSTRRNDLDDLAEHFTWPQHLLQRMSERQERQPSPIFNRSFISLADAARAVLERRPLLVTFINDAYVTMTNNWLCHTRHIDGLHDNLLILAEDQETKTKLLQQWPHLAITTITTANFSLHGSLQFNTVGYVRMMIRRTELLNNLLQSGIHFILFETDFIWYENPIPDFLFMAYRDNLDLVGTKSAVNDQIMCGGFIYFRSTPRTRMVWQEVLRQMHVLEARMERQDNGEGSPEKENEQRYLNTLLKSNWSGIQYGLVDYNHTVVDGRWYKRRAVQRRYPRPKAVHNNFLDTWPQKVQRFKRFSQWVLDDDGACDDRRVMRLLTYVG